MKHTLDRKDFEAALMATLPDHVDSYKDACEELVDMLYQAQLANIDMYTELTQLRAQNARLDIETQALAEDLSKAQAT